MRMIFVVGAARSGTTMMARILGNHPEVFTFQELHFFEELWDGRMPPRPLVRQEAARLAASLLSIQRDGYFARRRRDAFSEEAEKALDPLAAPVTAPGVFEAVLRHETQRQGKDIACLQTPRDVYYIPQILQLFPAARVVNMIRDPRAVLLSQKRRWRRYYETTLELPWTFLLRAWLNYHPIAYSLIWKRAVAVGEACADHTRVVQIRFEDLLERQELALEQLCRSLDLAVSSRMLQVPQVGSSNRPDRAERLGLDVEAADRWRREGLNPTEMWLRERLCERPLLRHGYSLVRRPNALHLAFYAVSWVPKTGLAFLLNLRRTRAPLGALRRRLGRGAP